MNSCFIIIPAYNEQAVLQQVIAGIRQVSAAEIVLVDDGSEPPLQVPAAGGVHLLRHCVNLGQGAAIATGITYALEQGATLIITFDADGQHDAADLAALTAPVLSGEVDIALGSRFLDARNQVPAGRRLLIFCARCFHFLLTRTWMTDAHNGLRAMNRKAATKISIRENRMAHATEIILEIKRNKLAWKEVPVHISYTEYSLRKGQRASNGLRIFFDVVLHKLFR